jgi:hypothetical protein
MTMQTTVEAPIGDNVLRKSPPTLEEILALSASSDDYFRAFHRQCSTEEEYYFLTRPTPHPEGVDPVRPATARAIIDVATDHVDVNNMTIDIPLMLRSKARAERLKKLYLGVWNNIREPVLRTAVKHSFAYGIGWLKVTVNMHTWNDAPMMSNYGVTLDNGDILLVREKEYKEDLQAFLEKRRITFPFVAQNVNPKEMRWDDSANGPKWVIRKVQTTAGDVKKKHVGWQTGKKDSEGVTWTEYWDDHYYAYMVDKEFVRPPTVHGYGFLNFIPILPANALDFDAGPPEKRYQGILFPVHQLLDSEARLVTQIQAILRTVAWRTLDFQGPRAAAEAAYDEYELFGGKNLLPPGVEVKPSPMVNLPPDLTAHLSMVQTMIEEATFPNVVRGLRPAGVSSGFGVSVLSGMGRLRFQGTADGLSRAVEKCNRGWAMLLENVIRGPVTVHARSEVHNFDETIRPADVNGYYENRVTFKAEAPEERERESLLARQLYQTERPMISLYEGQRRIGIANPLDEQNQMAAEELVRQLQPEQLEKLRQRLGAVQAGQQAQAAGQVPATLGAGQVPATGNQFMPGLSQLQRPGEANNQAARIASRDGRPSVFPRGQGGLDILGRAASSSGGGPVGLPSGGAVRR